MPKVLSLAFLSFWVFQGTAFAQDLSGTYTLSSQGTTLTLTLTQDAQGKIKGTLISTTEAKFQIEGLIQNGVGVGTCVDNQGGSYFEAHPKESQQLLALIEPDANKNPDYKKVKQLMFSPKSGTLPGQQRAQALPGQPSGPFSAIMAFPLIKKPKNTFSASLNISRFTAGQWNKV